MFALPSRFRRVLFALFGLAVLLSSATIPTKTAHAAYSGEIRSVSFWWSNNNNGSIVVRYDASCETRSLTSQEVQPTNQFLGSWTWGAINGVDQRYAATNIYPDLQSHGVSEIHVTITCRANNRTTSQTHRVFTTWYGNSPLVSWHPPQ